MNWLIIWAVLIISYVGSNFYSSQKYNQADLNHWASETVYQQVKSSGFKGDGLEYCDKFKNKGGRIKTACAIFEVSL